MDFYKKIGLIQTITAVVAAVLILLCLLFGGLSYMMSTSKYQRAIRLEDEYDVYYNGKHMNDDFSIRALGKKDISIKFDDYREEIYINNEKWGY